MSTQPLPGISGMSEENQSMILPNDEYNQQLVRNVHPGDWTNPEPTGRYNLVVVGAGTAGLITAVVAASLGAKVALIEKHLMGEIVSMLGVYRRKV
ncbi:MAG: NAD(P)/FAD-dependent oxidoreductase [Nitrospira sp.]